LHPHLEKIYEAVSNQSHKLESIICSLKEIKMDQQEFTAQLEAQAAIIEQTKGTVDKVYNEVQANTQSQLAAIDALKAEIASSGTGLSDAAVAALEHIVSANSALMASVQSLDDLTPDPA
jgi:uncharacterized protein YaaN involved in tellurite resistance